MDISTYVVWLQIHAGIFYAKYICISYLHLVYGPLVSIGTADGLAPVRRQGICCANDDQDPDVKRRRWETMS